MAMDKPSAEHGVEGDGDGDGDDDDGEMEVVVVVVEVEEEVEVVVVVILPREPVMAIMAVVVVLGLLHIIPTRHTRWKLTAPPSVAVRLTQLLIPAAAAALVRIIHQMLVGQQGRVRVVVVL